MSISDFANPTEVRCTSLSGERVVFDGYIQMYKFLTSIRRDGDYVRNSNGDVISHLIGLYNRIGSHLANGVQPIFVFDGPPPDMKQRTIDARVERKNEAEKLMEQAKQNGNTDDAEKYAARTTSVEPAFVESACEMFDALGVPYMEAPSEADPQCAHLVRSGEADYICTTDYDVFCYNDQNAAFIKQFSGDTCQIVSLQQMLNEMEINYDQYRWTRIIAGTDYNDSPSRVAWKRALNMTQDAESFERAIDAAVEWDAEIDTDRYRAVYDWFQNPTVGDWSPTHEPTDPEAVREVMIEKYHLQQSQVENKLDEIVEQQA